MTRRPLIALAILCSAAAATPSALAARNHAGVLRAASAKTHVIKLSGFTFGGTKAFKLAVPAGDSLRFVWVSGSHNVLYSRAPAGFTRVSAPKVTSSRPPLTVKMTKRGTYGFYCAPHRALGMTATVTVK
jgi:plastocyanin